MFINLPKELPIVNVHHVEQNIGISKEFNFFELQKAIGSKNFNKSIQIANYFAENDSKLLDTIFMGLGVINSYFGKLYQLHDVKNKSKDDICKLLNISSYFFNDYVNSIQLYSKDDIEIVLGYIKYYDLCIKGVDNVGRTKGELLIELTVKILKVNEIKKIKNLN
jgi:DNA polymerase-3 subunit delta